MRRHPVLGLAGVLAVVAAAAITAVAGRGGSATADPPPGGTPTIHLGPQGTVPQFVVKCAYSHSAPNDPIVHPDMTGMSHRHDFFGNRTTDASSTLDALVGGPTTCDERLDTAAYWAPSLLDHGEPVTPLGVVAYYRPAPGVDPTTLATIPAGLMMIAGDATAQGPQAIEDAAWTCGSSSDLQTAPPTCPADAPLRARMTFADCWDGRHLDAADHRSHVARSIDGRCPRDHPVVMPQLTLTVRYPVSGGGHELSLASGPTYTVHADFLNAWDEHELTSRIDLCLHRGVVCSVASNRAEDEPQPRPS